MKKCVSGIYLLVLILTSSSSAATLTDNFDNGLSSQLWQATQTNASDSPWNISAPDEIGMLKMSKAADKDSLTYVGAAVSSKFTLLGDFSVSVDFHIINLPSSSAYGWNETFLNVGSLTTQSSFQIIRLGYQLDSGQAVEAWSSMEGDVGLMTDYTNNGIFKITRSGNRLSAYINRGYGDVLVGSTSSNSLLDAMNVNICLVQQDNCPLGRPHNALDVRFDNFTATADSIIIPEPVTFALVGLGGLLLRRKK